MREAHPPLRHDGAVVMVYSEQYQTREEALVRERQLKRWSRAKKEALIAGNPALLMHSDDTPAPMHHGTIGPRYGMRPRRIPSVTIPTR